MSKLIRTDFIGKSNEINLIVASDVEIHESMSIFGSNFNNKLDVDYTVPSITNMLKNLGIAYTDYFNNIQAGPLRGTGNSETGKFGGSVSISGDGNTAAVLAWEAISSSPQKGAVWIFIKQNETWLQQGSIILPNDDTGFAIGNLSSIIGLSSDGNTLVIGAENTNAGIGGAYVFVRSSGIWAQQAKISGTGSTGTSRQGRAVSISGDGNTIALGGPLNGTTSGATWVFVKNGTIWTQQGSILLVTGGGPNYFQGAGVSLSYDGNTLVIGAPNNGSIGEGGIWIFNRTNGVWEQTVGPLIGTGYTSGSSQGGSVSISGDGNTIVVGGEGTNANIGAFWVFTKTNDVWTQFGDANIANNIIFTGTFGNSVSINYDGTIIICAARYDNYSIGSFWVYILQDSAWVQSTKITTQDTSDVLEFGTSVSISSEGTTLIVGVPRCLGDLGCAWIYTSE